jgi:hypothetical protein
MAMTDARFPERWLMDRRLDQLNDHDFRSFAYSLMWSVSNQTDGVIEESDFARIPRFDPKSVGALVAVEVWAVTENKWGEICWQVADFVDTQTSRDDLVSLRKARAANTEKQRRRRARRAEETDVPGYVQGYRNRGTAQDRLGQARTGPEDTEGVEAPDSTERNSRAIAPRGDRR